MHAGDDSGPPAVFTQHLPDADATARLGARLAGALRPGLMVYLSGPLGAGKTALVRAVLRALGYAGRVKSPTFTLMELYPLDGFDVVHFDLYRFTDPREWRDAGFQEACGGAALCLAEWPEKGAGVLPPADLRVTLALTAGLPEAGRDLTLTPGSAPGREALQRFRAAGPVGGSA